MSIRDLPNSQFSFHRYIRQKIVIYKKMWEDVGIGARRHPVRITLFDCSLFLWGLRYNSYQTTKNVYLKILIYGALLCNLWLKLGRLATYEIGSWTLDGEIEIKKNVFPRNFVKTFVKHDLFTINMVVFKLTFASFAKFAKFRNFWSSRFSENTSF